MSYCTVCDVSDKKPEGRCPACGRNYGKSILDAIAGAQVCNLAEYFGLLDVGYQPHHGRKKKPRGQS